MARAHGRGQQLARALGLWPGKGRGGRNGRLSLGLEPGHSRGGWFHWDGNNNSLIERNYSAALAGGAKEWLLQRGLIDAQAEWLRDLPPPAYPLPVNADMAADGAAICEREGCGTCHDPGGESFGQVTPLSDLQTDPARSDLFDDAFVSRFGDVGKGYTWRFSHYRATEGYANTPLDAIWARGPISTMVPCRRFGRFCHRRKTVRRPSIAAARISIRWTSALPAKVASCSTRS